MKKIYLLFFLLITLGAFAQNAKPCSAKEVSQFDFWLGDWDLTWNDSVRGSNSIKKMFGNCTVHENFSDPKLNYLGQSWSVYNVNYKKWEQTWVDNAGGYIHLSGGMQGDSMVLTTEQRSVPASVSPTGKIVSRMVFHHITSDSFDWSWESSTDGGRSWKPAWQIRYTRKKS